MSGKLNEFESHPMTVGELLLLTCGMAAVSGFMQNGARVAALLAGKRWDHGVHVWWQAPAGDLLVFGAVTMCILTIGIFFPALRRLSTVLPIMVGLSTMSVLLLLPRLHLWAGFVLAAGIGLRLRSLIRTQPRLFAKIIRPATTALIGLTTIVAGSVYGWYRFAEARASRSSVQTTQGAPNVLILIWDTVRASSLSLYGHERATTPYLDSLARTGVTFNRAIATASYTLPSHASIFTGRWAHELNVNWRTPLDRSAPTLAEVLHAAGYRTGGFSANLIYLNHAWGLDRGFAHFETLRAGSRTVIRSSTMARAIANWEPVRRLLSLDEPLSTVTAKDNEKSLLAWLRRGDKGRPYFAFVNYMEAHNPYLPRERFVTRLFGARSDEDRKQVRRLARSNLDEMSLEEAKLLQREYEGAIADLDDQVGQLLATMAREGLLENTLIIVAADHGEEFGEHKLFGHGNSLYLESLHVPLVVTMPGRVPANLRVNNVVSTRDIPSTVLDLLGMSPLLPGTSLRTLWESQGGPDSATAFSFITGDPRLTPAARSRTGDLSSAVSAQTQLIRNPDGSLEAFDLVVDKHGNTPVAGLPADAKRLAGAISVRRP